MSETPNEKEVKKQRGILSTLKRLVMCEPKPKEEPGEPKEEKPSSELIIYFTNGDIKSWTYTGEDKGMRPWRYFYKWWFSRKDSEHYIFRYNGGEQMIRRDLVKTFTLKYGDT